MADASRAARRTAVRGCATGSPISSDSVCASTRAASTVHDRPSTLDARSGRPARWTIDLPEAAVDLDFVLHSAQALRRAPATSSRRAARRRRCAMRPRRRRPATARAWSAAAIAATSSVVAAAARRTAGRSAPAGPRRDRSCGTGPATKSGWSSSQVKNGTRRLDAGDDVLAERAAHARDRGRADPRPRRPASRSSGRRRSARRGPAVAPLSSRMPGPGRRAQLRGCGPATAESCCRDPRRRCGTRWRGPSGVSSRAGIEVEPLAARDANLPVHQIDAGHHLGDRMLDLQPRVHLEEVEAAVLVEQELDRAGVGVADRARDRGRGAPSWPARSAGVTASDGVSSTTFWWRR